MRIWFHVARRAAAFLAACALLACAALAESAAGENLLINPGASLSEGEALPEGWTPDMWDTAEGVSRLEATADGRDGGTCLHVVNEFDNDARFIQTVAVAPMTLYELSGWIRASDCGDAGVGANLSAWGTFSYSEAVYDTAGEWVRVALYGITGDRQTELTVMARLGGYSSTCTGEAWFDDIELRALNEVPEDADIQLLDPGASDSGASGGGEGAKESDRGYWPSVMVAVLYALAAAAWCLYAARRGEPGALGAPGPGWAGPGLILTALCIRLTFAVCVRGYSTDMSCFLAWSSRVADVGPGAFYSSSYFCDYPPGYLYALWLVGALRGLVGLTADGPGAWLLVKLPCVLADCAACMLIYRVSRKPLGEKVALALTSLYALNPAVILDSSVWGQTDGMLALLVVAAIWLATEEKWLRAICLYAVAVLVKPQALLFAPVGAFMAVMWIVRSKNRPRAILALLGAVAAAAGLFVALALPFARSQASAWFPEAPAFLQPLLWIVEKYAGTLSSYPYYSVNACNFWLLLGKNWVTLSGGLWEWAGWAAYAAAFGFALWMYARAKEPKRAFLLCATAMTLIFCFGLKMHERYLLPAILLLCMAYAFDRDIRIPLAAILLSCTQFVNAALVLRYTYLSDGPAWLAAGTAASLLAGCALLVWTCWDLCALGKSVGVTRIYRPSAARMRLQEKQARRAAGSGLFDRPDARLRLSARERLVMLLVTALYALFSLVNLGSTVAPQTSWVSSAAGESVTFDLGCVRSFQTTYYGGICDSTFTLEFSATGDSYTEPSLAQYNAGEVFRWLWYRPMAEDSSGNLRAVGDYGLVSARYIRLTALEAGLTLSEVAFLSAEGEPYPVASLYADGGDPASDPMALVDEQEIVPEHPSYYNGSYFDEVYHVRTAYEHIHGMHAYEWTHPPLGKLLIGVGIRLFGMTPFGWRFMGALSGILMVPLMYLCARQLTKNKFAAFFAMMLMALDCMHFTQSRIGTIDCFAVLFIMCMYLCMFRYVKMNFYHDPLPRTLVPLALCGVSFALGCATKWICIYSGVGLAALFFYSLARRFLEYRFAKAGMRAFTPEEKRVAKRAEATFAKNTAITLLWCVLFFVIVPTLTYYFSYYWQMTPDGNFSVASVLKLQETMFNYHNGLSNDTHYFRSPWYEWPLIVKPIWYYSGNEFQPQGVISSISCMGNPAVWWGGLAGLLYTLYRIPAAWRKDRRNAMLAVGFFSQFAPWIFVARSTFIYHYFASVPFVILCATVLVDDLCGQDRRLGRRVGIAWMAAALALCAFFYPIMSGTPIPLSWARLLRWFSWYNF